MKNCSLCICLLIILAQNISCNNLPSQQLPVTVSDRTMGLLMGSMLGDALGGPIEFQSHESIQQLSMPPKLWQPGEQLDSLALIEAAQRIILRPYTPLRPLPEPYGHWTLEPGAVTDDTRHKMILLYALRKHEQDKSFPIDYLNLADAYIKWAETPFIATQYSKIAAEHLEETYKSVRWLQGNRNKGEAYPPSRLWSGLPTCYGSMSLLPLAAIYPNQPELAYKAAYDLAFFDNAFARDLNASMLAGLSVALSLDANKIGEKAAWEAIYQAMRSTDPYAYGQVPWTTRSVDRYLDLAINLAKQAEGQPYKLFAALEDEFKETIKWEAHVPFVVVFSCLEICNYKPLAALELSIEWGHDHDSYAQVMGAFIGALYGVELFDAAQIAKVKKQLLLDYNEDADEWGQLLTRLELQAKNQILIHN